MGVTTRAPQPPVQGPWTYARLCAETEVDNVRREIIDGWLYVYGRRVRDPLAAVAADSPSLYHAGIVLRLGVLLDAYTRQQGGGMVVPAPMDVLLGDAIVQPDVFFLAAAEGDVRPVTTRPELVVEVSSPSTVAHDLVRKRRVYEQAGVPEYWFVDRAAERFACYRLVEGTYGPPTLVPRGGTVHSSALPGFAVAVDEVLGEAAQA